MLALAAASLTQLPADGAPAPSARGADASGDTTRAQRVERGPDGSVRAFSAPRDARDPAVEPSTDPRLAARLHLARYDAVLGAGGTSWVGGTMTRTVTGDDVVRFRQRRDGLPVIGGAVAVDLRPDRQLASVTASLSQASVPGATYPREAARREALAVATKQLGAERARSPPTDPSDGSSTRRCSGCRAPPTRRPTPAGCGGSRCTPGPAFHRLVLVDDRSGAVVQDLDLVEQVDRVVCDDHNYMTQLDLPCTKDFARTEHGPVSQVKDVNDAFALAGVVSRFYRRIGHLDLTRAARGRRGRPPEPVVDGALLRPVRAGRRSARWPTRSGTASGCSTARASRRPTTSSATR